MDMRLKWLGFDFERAGGNRTDIDEDKFNEFAKDFEYDIQQQLGKEYKVTQSTGKYFIFGHIKYQDKYVYYKTPDVRGDGGWCFRITLRRVENESDTIGFDNYVPLVKFGEKVKELFEKKT